MTTPLLETIQGPQDIKKFSTQQLKQLCQEIRERIIEVVSINGGHLSSNLGSVELTVAFHKAFNSPLDKICWDTSHQVYPHKLLTGRNKDFPSLRQFEGLCGFTDPRESPHDHFYAGHAGTALSLALGLAHSRDLHGGDDFIVTVLGDAALGCGVTLEALNNIPPDLKNFVVVLNDNAMAISKNVGAVTRILSRLLNNPTSNKFYSDINHLIRKIPSYGHTLANKGKRIKESLKNLVSPAVFFEQYGLSYVGPIDGHSMEDMISVFEQVKESKGPVVVHALTEKGHGMTDGMRQNPINWHGAKPFCPKTGKLQAKSSSAPTFPKVFGQYMLKMADQDPHLMVITPAMSLGSCLDPLMEKYPSRCLDVGIAESHAVTFAGGLAKNRGTRVVLSVYSTFLQRGFDNLFHDVCLQEVPVVFAIDRGGIAGNDGATHNGIYDLAWLNAMPNMVIAQPRNGQVLKELLESAFSYQRPVSIRYPNLGTEVQEEVPLKRRDLACGEVLAQGEDILVIALGHCCKMALEVRDLLKRDCAANVTVLDPVFVKPLDAELLHRLLKTHQRIVTIEEHSLRGGLGSIINNFLMRNEYYEAQSLNIGIPDQFVHHGSHKALCEAIGLTAEAASKRIIQHFDLIPAPPSDSDQEFAYATGESGAYSKVDFTF